jgi:hypothetical protein
MKSDEVLVLCVVRLWLYAARQRAAEDGRGHPDLQRGRLHVPLAQVRQQDKMVIIYVYIYMYIYINTPHTCEVAHTN